MLTAMMRRVPLSLYSPLRHAVFRFKRRNPVRMAATLILRRAVVANRGRLSKQLRFVRPLDDPGLMFEPSDSMVMETVFWFGIRGYENTVPRAWALLSARAHSILEVGGNIGIFTVIGARATKGRYTVIEPLPQNMKVLRANLALNGLSAVEAVEAAAIGGDDEIVVQINVPDEGRENPVGAHVTIGSEVAARTSACTLSVPGLPIRKLAERCDLIKIDAEGLEYALLSELREQLVRDRPDLLIEVLPEAANLAGFLADLAAAAGYTIYVLPEYGTDLLVEVPAATFDANTPTDHNGKDVVLSTKPLPQGLGVRRAVPPRAAS